MAPIALLLLLTQVAATRAIETRVVEPRDAPVSLVGLPCGDQNLKLRAEAPAHERAAHKFLETKPFACKRHCAVGVRIKEGVSVTSFTIATATAYDRRRVTTTISPALTMATLQSCNGESYAVGVMSNVRWPASAGALFVSDVTFADGTTWHADSEAVVADALQEWILQPKRAQQF